MTGCKKMQKYRNAKKIEVCMDKALEYTVKKRKATRISYRMVGVIFFAGGVALILWAVLGKNGTVGRMLKLAFGLACVAYGLNLVKASFRKAAFDATFVFGDEAVLVKQEKRNTEIPYEKLTNVNLVIPDPDMAYYMLKLDTPKDKFVLPFMGSREKCDAIYYFLLKKTGIMEDMEDKA